MNIASIIILALVIALLALAFSYLSRHNGCAGCSACDHCDGRCGHFKDDIISKDSTKDIKDADKGGNI